MRFLGAGSLLIDALVGASQLVPHIIKSQDPILGSGTLTIDPQSVNHPSPLNFVTFSLVSGDCLTPWGDEPDIIPFGTTGTTKGIHRKPWKFLPEKALPLTAISYFGGNTQHHGSRSHC